MKGLLLKDVYIIGKLCKTFIIIDILCIALSFLGDEFFFFVAYMCIFTGFLPLTLISYDKREKWDIYAGTLPYTHAQLVSSKYLIGLFGSVIVVGLIAMVLGCKMAISGTFELEMYASMITALLAIRLIIPAILYPLVYRFGPDKGRIFFYIGIVLTATACSLLNEDTVPDISLEVTLNWAWGIVFLTLTAAVIYALSWLLSIYFYKKCEL